MAETIVMRIKQGEELSIGFTIRQGEDPLDLNEYSIGFQVKKNPIVKAKPIVDKIITKTSDINTVGRITYPEQGQLVVHLLPEDTSFPIGDYYLVISLQKEGENNIISSPACTTATYSICEQ